MKKIPIILALLLAVSGTAMAEDSNLKTAVGGGLGAAAGTALGGILGGKNGELIGGAVGGGVGGAVSTRGEGRTGAVLGGAAGGVTGAAVGHKVGGSTGAIVGAGAGGAGGAVIGKIIAEPGARERRTGYYDNAYYDDDHEYRHGHAFLVGCRALKYANGQTCQGE